MIIFGIPIPNRSTSIKGILMVQWLRAGRKNLVHIFKHNLSGIICWHLWKVYSSIIWGSDNRVPSHEFIIFQIKLYTQNWAISLSNLKIRVFGDVLYEEKLIHSNFKFKGGLFKAIKWKRSKEGFKLNTDAKFFPGIAAGGAILRNSDDEMSFAISFPPFVSSPLEAELASSLYATNWTIAPGFSDFLVEMDVAVALRYISDGGAGRWKEYQEMLLRAFN
ncbi:unnamed protein product, partial [Cuscuta epithymum]